MTAPRSFPHTERRLRARFADLTEAEVHAAVVAAARRLQPARIDTFLDVLVERHAGAALRRWRADGSGPAGMTGRPLVYVLRHAAAVDSRCWTGPDIDRPLDPRSPQDAASLGRWFDGFALVRLLSSPSRRCLDTLAPLSRDRHLDIEPDNTLVAGASPAALIARITDPRLDRVVLCTHGELMRPLLAHLQADGTEIVTDHRDDDWLLSKGGVWAIEHEDGAARRLIHAAPGRGWTSRPLPSRS